MKVLVTGGAGFIGTNLTLSLLEHGYDVKIFDDLSTGLEQNIPKDAEFINASILDTSKLNNAIKECEVVVHLGARGSVPRSIKDPIATHDVNSSGTLNVLEAARTSGSHYIFSSSSSVYGSNMTLPKSEDMVLKPLTPYAASKMSGEALSLAYAKSYELPVSTFRFFNIFGPWQRPDHEYAAVLPKWISKCMKDDEIEIFGDGEQTRDFTYVGTVVNVIIDCISNKILHPEPVNLAYGNNISLNQVTELLKHSFLDIKVKYLPQRNGDVLHSKNDPKLVRSLYPNVNVEKFETSLQETINWFKESKI
jgi:UDP-glucose 4-epimerase